MKLCVLGLGYIGLPTAVMFANNGVKVHGVDINHKIIEMLKKKEVPIKEPGLKEVLEKVIDEGNITFSGKPEKADVFIIAVPTPFHEDKRANLEYVKSATESIVPYLQKGNLVILESTVPPKTVDNVLIPMLKKTKLNIGEELLVAHSPERVYPGKLFKELVENDRIIGGINEKSIKATVQLYRNFVKGNFYTTNLITAEMVKLIENTYRDINIAYANELAKLAEKIGFNVWEAIDLANSHPRVNILQPGPGVGGHCIAVDPWFIIQKEPQVAQLISLGRKINEEMPFHVIKRIEENIKDIPKPIITLLGMAYKENIDDFRESPSLTILDELKNRGYQVKIYDPYVKIDFKEKVSSLEDALENTDCIVLLTKHDEFKEIDFTQYKKIKTKLIIDTRYFLNTNQLTSQGFKCILLGIPN